MLKKYFLKIIGLLIFVILLIKIDLKKAFVIIANAQLGFVILAFVLAFIIFLIRTWRWQSVLKAQGNKYNFFDLIKSGLGGGYFASITPGQVGDFIKVYYLKQYGKITSGKAVSSILLDRFMNIPVLLVISVIALYFFLLIVLQSKKFSSLFKEYF